MKPITPQEVNRIKIPDTILGIINDLIVEKFHGSHAEFFEEDLISKIIEKIGCQRSEIFENDWININKIKPIYEKVGWEVLRGTVSNHPPYHIVIYFDVKKENE